VDVENTVCPGNDLDDADQVLPLLKDARRQTDGVGPRPSGDAVLDPEVVAIRHLFDSTTRPKLTVGLASKAPSSCRSGQKSERAFSNASRLTKLPQNTAPEGDPGS
jgi:hypothetical protein